MELEKMKEAWAAMSVQADKQKKLTDQLILDMTRQKYARKLDKIKIPEVAGTVACFAIVFLILFRLNTFGTGYLLICALFSASYLLVLPILSLRAIYRMDAPPLGDLDNKAVLTWYAIRKRHFLAIQKASLLLGFLLLITFPPVSLRLMNGNVRELAPSAWLRFSLIGLLLFAVLARWVYGYYARTTRGMERMLHDLEEDA